eukprot:6174567-Pleurochrysis_carterae.AAC.4
MHEWLARFNSFLAAMFNFKSARPTTILVTSFTAACTEMNCIAPPFMQPLPRDSGNLAKPCYTCAQRVYASQRVQELGLRWGPGCGANA